MEILAENASEISASIPEEPQQAFREENFMTISWRNVLRNPPGMPDEFLLDISAVILPYISPRIIPQIVPLISARNRPGQERNLSEYIKMF